MTSTHTDQSCHACTITTEDGSMWSIVFVPAELDDENWMANVSKEAQGSRVIFVRGQGAMFSCRPFLDGMECEVDAADARMLGHALRHLQKRKTGDQFSVVPNDGLAQATVPPRDGAAIKHDTVLTKDGLDQLIASENAVPMKLLVEHLRSPLGVIPFVGAGFSVPFGFPQWGEFLIDAARFTEEEVDVRKYVSEGKYEKAAEVLLQSSANALQDKIDVKFRRKVNEEQLRDDKLSLLPSLASGPVITTNFDRLIEQAFELSGHDFEKVVSGPLPDDTVRAIHQNQRALLKIHGDSGDRTFRTLTSSEYERQWSDNAPLESLVWMMFTNRPLLFLGCSLDRDQTVTALKRVQSKLKSIRHFAVVASLHSCARRAERCRVLDECGVRRIWFPPGEFARIQTILTELILLMSTRPLADAPKTRITAVRSDFKEPDAFPSVARELPAPTDAKSCQAVASALFEGRVTFFLGAYAHLRRFPLGDAFYKDLARDFDANLSWGDRATVAGFVREVHGFDAVWNRIKKTLQASDTEPSSIYRFLATLPAFLRGRGQDRPLVVFTTN